MIIPYKILCVVQNRMALRRRIQISIRQHAPGTQLRAYQQYLERASFSALTR
jgi:hypothetical protein